MHLHIVPARTGLEWARAGVRTFLRQPVALSGMFFLFMALMSLATVVPLVGFALALGLLPTATLGMMAAAREAAAGRFARPALLFVGLRSGREKARAMGVLGLLYVLGFLLMMGASALCDGGTFAGAYVLGSRMDAQTMGAPGVQAAMWVALLLYLPLSMLFWHASALVFWHGVAPVKSLFFSFVACLRNMGAFAVYALAWTGIFVVGGLAAGLVTTLLVVSGILGSGESALATALITGVMVGTALVMAAMFFTSLYATFTACFGAPPEADDAAARQDHDAIK